jgi:hypothetical protein
VLNPLQAVAAVLLPGNCIVSVYAVRSPYFSALQKAAQCLIVWALPSLGPIFVWNFLRTQDNRAAKRSGPSITVGYDNTIVVTDSSHDSIGGGGHDGAMH